MPATIISGVDLAISSIQAFSFKAEGATGMSEFWKRPKFWIGAIVILWLAYIIYANSQPAPVVIHLVPWFVTLQLKLSAVITGGAMLGCLLTLAVQYLWRRTGSSKPTAVSAPAPSASSSTVA
jgi:hypothetical protein